MIGIDHYRENLYDSLPGCVEEAKALKELLQTNANGDDNVPESQIQCLFNEKATLPAIEKAVRKLLIGAPELVIFYFSGHGYFSETGGYLVTFDGKPYVRGFPMNSLIHLARISDAENVIIIIDCCHAGAAGTEEFISGKELAKIPEKVSIISASTANQKAQMKNRASIFTRVLIQGLKGRAADAKGYITVPRLYDFISKEFASYSQNPQLKVFLSQSYPIRNSDSNFNKPKQKMSHNLGFYHLFFLQAGREDWLDTILSTFEERMETFQIHSSSVKIYKDCRESLLSSTSGVRICVLMKAQNETLSPAQLVFLARARKENIVIIPLYDHNLKDGKGFYQQVPEIVQDINAFPWVNDDSARELVSELFENLSITEGDRRVFISYKRSDGSAYAEQLFDLLNRSGFRVFKDDYSVKYGDNFQKSLMEELEDFAYLLLVETEESGQSKWVEKEINFALDRHMGVAIIRLPDHESFTDTAGKASGQPILKISPEDIYLKEIKSGKSFGHFSDARIQTIKQFVIESHAERVFSRKKYLFDTIVEKCEFVHQEFKVEKNWRLILDRFELQKPVLIGVSYRPPRPVDLYRLEKDMDQHNIEYGILVHDAENMSDQRMDLNHWSVRGNKVELQFVEEFLANIK